MFLRSLTSKLHLTTRVFSSFGTHNQKFIVLFGAPGVGKGTFAKLIHKDTNFNHISTGDEIRKILKGQTPEGFDRNLITQIKDIVNSGLLGGLVSDQIVMNILQEKMKEPQSQKGVILDGFPRTINQLELYEKLFPITVVINFTLRYDVLLEKMMARRTCVGCGAVYNICDINRDGYKMEPLPPKVEGHCDVCNSALEIRKDDTEEVISFRFKEYESKTVPLLDRYKQKGVLVDFEVKTGKKDYPRLKQVLTPYLGV